MTNLEAILISKYLSDSLFELGREQEQAVRRIEFKGGQKRNEEVAMGGLTHKALEKFFVGQLKLLNDQ